MIILRCVARAALQGALAVAAFISLYAAFAVALGLLPVNRGVVPPAAGIEIFLVGNGVHASLALPLKNSIADLQADFPLPDGHTDSQGVLVLVGWGDRLVYTETPQWRDLKLLSAATALLGLNAAVMHVEHIRRPKPFSRSQPLHVSDEGYRRLVGHVRASLNRDPQGRAVRIAGHSHGRRDAFYEGRGRYTLIYTCNEWVREGLARAGVRTATWAPLDIALFWQLRR